MPGPLVEAVVTVPNPPFAPHFDAASEAPFQNGLSRLAPFVVFVLLTEAPPTPT